MKSILRVLLFIMLALTLAVPPESAVFALTPGGDGQNTVGRDPYAFEIRSQAGKTMSVQFLGNKMFHAGRYIGWRRRQTDDLLRYMAESFGFRRL